MNHYKQKETIPYYMCDRNHQLTLSMLVNLLIEVSENHSALLGREESYMENLDISWIILRYEFKIDRLPDAKEKIEIETFATEYNKLFTYRTFIVRDNQNNQLIEVKVTFALMDHATRKMVRIPNEVVAPYAALFSRRIRRELKPHEIDKSQIDEKSYEVRYFDIDTNNHVNNSKYIEWLLDSLNSAFLKTHAIRHGIITFDKEVKEGNTVTSKVSKRLTDELFTDHRIEVDGTTHASASFKWTEKSEKGV
ncbi:acyl-[acyl-carrier-protein] thioesterase [Alkalibacterium kapii]|uniref:Acyl-ACP thioesterase n=1 Tax=Alkalibacterium kapii TaxID=426704 RepID=A0A511AR18_9LACT|nr:acyl-ACP thioesterase domain-containing protein [Alkalibacterium kapii]GEK90526.1 acyl-ACP thioesterase [Alkalibacterium kapii]